MKFAEQLLAGLFRPQLLLVAAAHSGGQMVINIRIERVELGDMLLDILTHGVAVVGAGVFDRLQTELGDELTDFAFAIVEQRTQYGDAAARQRRYRQKGAQLAAGHEIHKKCFYGIVIMMGKRDLVEAKLLGAAVGGSAAEVGTGEAGAAAFFGVCLHDVYVVAVMRKAEASAEFLQLGLGKIGGKHAVDGVAGKLEGNQRIFFDFCEHSG